jgi:hypothetical protein
MPMVGEPARMRPQTQQLILKTGCNKSISIREPHRVGRYDVLLIVQPSSLGPPQLTNVVDVVRKGQASVIFEDPYPVVMPAVGTTTEKPPQGGGMFGWAEVALSPRETSAKPSAFNRPATKANCAHQGEVVWRSTTYPKFNRISIRARLHSRRHESDQRLNQRAGGPFEEVLFPFPTSIAPKMGEDEGYGDCVHGDKYPARSTSISCSPARNPPVNPTAARPTARNTFAAWIRAKAPVEDAEKDRQKLSRQPRRAYRRQEAGRHNAIYVTESTCSAVNSCRCGTNRT